MDNAPILMLCGPAGSGKDTAAGFIRDYIPNTVLLPQAAPLKDLGSSVFKFTEDQLYGPSESRNAPDHRFVSKGVWTEMRWDKGIDKWLNTNFEGYNLSNVKNHFNTWFDRLQQDTQMCGVTLTPRYMLQTLGTEFGRTIDPDIWAKIAMTKAKAKLVSGAADLVIITDGRFKNEVLNAKYNNAMAVLIMTPDAPKEVQGGVKGHASEAQLKTIPLFWYNKVIVNMKQFGLDYFQNQIHEFCNESFKGL
jgi:hypothetical protein